MTKLDEIGAAVEGVSKMLATILPTDCAFALIAFPIDGDVGAFHVTRSSNHRLALTARKFREAANVIDKKLDSA